MAYFSGQKVLLMLVESRALFSLETGVFEKLLHTFFFFFFSFCT